jgi:hypothetical protein
VIDAINTMYNTFSLCLIVETADNDKIINLVCTTVMGETEEFIRQIICGHSLVKDVDEIIDILKRRFHALVQKTLIVALKDAQNRYFMLYPEKRINV